MLAQNKKITIEREIYNNSQRKLCENHFKVTKSFSSKAELGSPSTTSPVPPFQIFIVPKVLNVYYFLELIIFRGFHP